MRKNVCPMKYHLLSLTSCLLLLVFSAPTCPARQWRNVTPLCTTRAEVLRLFGTPKHDQPDDSEYFDLDSELVTFRWLCPTCGTQNSIVDERSIQPSDLVLQITVRPKIPGHLKGIDLDKAPPKSFSDWLGDDVDCIGNGEDGVWNCSIIRGREGFGYTTSRDLVTAVYYFAPDAEAEAWNRGHEPCGPESEKGK